MSERLLLGVFASADDVLRATRAARDRGVPVLDVYSPHALHGLDEAMGWRASWLRWVALALGVSGAVFALWLQHWTSAVSWPVNVGGRPSSALPAFVPVIFEVAVLFAGVGTVLAFLFGVLRPGREARVPRAGVTDDRFVLAVTGAGPMDRERVRRLLESLGASSVEEQDVDDGGGEE